MFPFKTYDLFKSSKLLRLNCLSDVARTTSLKKWVHDYGKDGMPVSYWSLRDTWPASSSQDRHMP